MVHCFILLQLVTFSGTLVIMPPKKKTNEATTSEDSFRLILEKLENMEAQRIKDKETINEGQNAMMEKLDEINRRWEEKHSVLEERLDVLEDKVDTITPLQKHYENAIKTYGIRTLLQEYHSKKMNIIIFNIKVTVHGRIEMFLC